MFICDQRKVLCTHLDQTTGAALVVTMSWTKKSRRLTEWDSLLKIPCHKSHVESAILWLLQVCSLGFAKKVSWPPQLQSVRGPARFISVFIN